MCTEVTEQNVRYLRHVYNTSVKGMFRWNFMIFCGYTFFHMNHLEGQSPYWEANSQLVVKVISCLLWNLNVHYHNYKSQAVYPIWSLTNAVHIFIYDLFQISFNTVSYQCLSLASGVLPEGVPEELQYTLFIFPMSVTCPTQYFSVWIVQINSLKIFSNCVWNTISLYKSTGTEKHFVKWMLTILDK